MKKILFLIHDLGAGGAEKVLVNLVNHMDQHRFDITVMALFGGGVNEQFLKKHIRYQTVFPKTIRGNSHIMKLFSPQLLHRMFIREHYDIEVSYLEGPSARVISGCPDQDTKLVSWIHVEQHTMKNVAKPFRDANEAKWCYNRFDQTICVSKYVKDDFCGILDYKKPCRVLYNTLETEEIQRLAREEALDFIDDGYLRLIAVGTLKKSKGYERLLRIVKLLKDTHCLVHLYVLGTGPMESKLKDFILENSMTDIVTFLGYKVNPYKYVARSDLFVCSSYSEGFSTAATEALIVGTPVCTVDVSGMKELLGEKNEFGVVTENSEMALYQALRYLLSDSSILEHYRKQAQKRGESFHTESTVKAVEEMLFSITE